jgi:hypothetical protein
MPAADLSAKAHGSDWLTGCEGYDVETPGGRLGVVERIERTEDGAPEALVVRTGILGNRRLLVPTAVIAAVVSSRQAIVIEPWSPMPAVPARRRMKEVRR